MELPSLPARNPAGHKGTFGTVCVVAGCAAPPAMMLGSAVLAGMGALRAGAALAMLAAPEPLLPAMLAANPSATGIPLPVDEHNRLVPSLVAERLDAMAGRVNAMAIGPGLGTEFEAQQVVMRLVAQDLPRPLIIDADAINCLALTPEFTRDLRCRAVLTPHPGEFGRLARALGLQGDEAPPPPEARAQGAQRMAQRLGAVIVLKGHGTVVSDGVQTWTCAHGNDALAIGGSGDVLTGIVAGLAAQFAGMRAGGAGGGQPTLSLLECACLAVQVHALAAEAWVARTGGTAGLLARELADEVPGVLARLRGGTRASS